MKKILFTIQWYPSNRSANVLCDANIMKALLETGRYEIHCLVYRWNNLPDYEVLDGLHIHRFKRSWFWTKWINSYTNTTSLNYKFWNLAQRIWLRIQQVLTIPIYPIYEPIECLRFVSKAVELNNKERFDIVISEHNGLDTLLAGYWIKKKFPSIKFFPIMWDPLVGREGAGYLPKNFCQKKLRNLQEKVFSSATAVFSMKSNEENLHSIATLNYLEKIIFLDIPRIVNPSLEQQDTTLPQGILADGAINILFAGTIAGRNIDQLVQIFNGIKQRLHLVFLVSTPNAEIRKNLGKFHGSFSLSGYLPHAQLMALYEKVDFVLNIGTSNANMVPSKIFEYMSLGLPIISTYIDGNDASLKYFRNYPLACALDLRGSEYLSAIPKLEKFVSESNGKRIPFDSIKDLYPDNVPTRYVEMIEKYI